jgi:hypothetical protein
MPAAEQTVELIETKDTQMFLPVMKGIDFGDRFLLSMLHWCGFGQRSTPPDYWQVQPSSHFPRPAISSS